MASFNVPAERQWLVSRTESRLSGGQLVGDAAAELLSACDGRPMGAYKILRAAGADYANAKSAVFAAMSADQQAAQEATTGDSELAQC